MARKTKNADAPVADGTAPAVDTAPVAGDAATNVATVPTTRKEVAALSLGALTDLFNSHQADETKRVKKMRNKASAVKAVCKILGIKGGGGGGSKGGGKGRVAALIDLKAKKVIVEPRAGSKREAVSVLLANGDGMTVEQVMEKIGWDRRTAREGIRLLHLVCGFGLTEDATTRKIRLLRPEA